MSFISISLVNCTKSALELGVDLRKLGSVSGPERLGSGDWNENQDRAIWSA